MAKQILVSLVLLLVFSCTEKTTHKKSDIKKPKSITVYKKVELEIEGMTCEIGCARTIESKLSKVDGITFSKVNFEAKKGNFTFDINKLSKEEIVAKITEIGGGNLYTVTNITEFQ